MVVIDHILRSCHELSHAEPTSRCPDRFDHRSRIGPVNALAFLPDCEVAVGHHVENHSAAIAMSGGASPLTRSVLPGKEERPQAILITRIIKDIFLSIEANKIDADWSRQGWHQLGQFHQHRHPTGPVIGPKENTPRLPRITIRIRPGVIVNTKQDPLGSLGMPVNNQVLHSHPVTVATVAAAESLPKDLSTRLLKMPDEELLLPLHAG
jgi:hypothetical protein